MIGVDLIGQIRRAFLEQRRPIKEIVRTLSVVSVALRPPWTDDGDGPMLSCLGHIRGIDRVHDRR